jgi:hypothetical protein
MGNVTAYIGEAGTGKLQINWRYDGHPRRQYHIDKQNIFCDGNKVRTALQALTGAWRKGQRENYATLLRDVALQGFQLYTDMVFGVGDQTQKDAATWTKNWLANIIDSRQDTVTFRVPEGIYVPWGLVYDDPNIQNPGSAAVRESFWCIKYNVATNFMDLMANGVERIWQTEDMPVLFGAHQEVWKVTRDKLRDPDRKHLSRLLNSIDQPKFSLEDLADLWDRRCAENKPFGLFCLLCHASGVELCIGTQKENSIAHNRFAQRFGREDVQDKPPTLVFLAGCQTAAGNELDRGFLHATSNAGYCGYIGAEVIVPDLFTLGFLSEFIERFYAGGRTVSDVMRELRREHWPLSLAFTMGCARELRLAVPPKPPAAVSGRGNLCDHLISSASNPQVVRAGQ